MIADFLNQDSVDDFWIAYRFSLFSVNTMGDIGALVPCHTALISALSRGI